MEFLRSRHGRERAGCGRGGIDAANTWPAEQHFPPNHLLFSPTPPRTRQHTPIFFRNTMAVAIDGMLETELGGELTLPWDHLPDVDLDQLLSEAARSPVDNWAGWESSSPPQDVSSEMAVDHDGLPTLLESTAFDLPPSPSVGLIEMELRTLIGSAEPGPQGSTTVKLTDSVMDSGVDGDTDDSFSDHASETSESTASFSSRLPQLPKVEVSGSPSPPPVNRSAHPRPRSGEALVAGITDRERELLQAKHGVSLRRVPHCLHGSPLDIGYSNLREPLRLTLCVLSSGDCSKPAPPHKARGPEVARRPPQDPKQGVGPALAAKQGVVHPRSRKPG